MWPQATPQSFSQAEAPADFTVSQMPFDDARTVEFTISGAEGLTVHSPQEGRVTGMTCSPGDSASSGSSIVSIDGDPLLSLSTSTPLWRDLTSDDAGPDVRSLQSELARLGYDVRVDGRVGSETLRAFHNALNSVGAAGTGATVEISRVLWLPAPSVQIKTCEAQAGAPIAVGDQIAVLQGSNAVLQITDMPTDLLEGPRIVQIGSTEVPVDISGRSTAALSQIPKESPATDTSSQTPEASANRRSGSLRLVTPVQVASVPPAAIYNLAGSKGCISEKGRGLAVTVVGSQLGQTYVHLGEAELPHTVDLRPRTTNQCR